LKKTETEKNDLFHSTSFCWEERKDEWMIYEHVLESNMPMKGSRENTQEVWPYNWFCKLRLELMGYFRRSAPSTTKQLSEFSRTKNMKENQSALFTDKMKI
jgi:hypothetical protein